MSVDARNTPTGSLPVDRIAEACRSSAVARLWVLESPDDEPEFLVEFTNGDAGPWGCKLDELQNDLSGSLHRAVRVHSRRGVDHSTSSPYRERILESARLIYES